MGRRGRRPLHRLTAVLVVASIALGVGLFVLWALVTPYGGDNEGIGHQGIGHQGIGHQGIGHQGIGHGGIGHEGIGHEVPGTSWSSNRPDDQPGVMRTMRSPSPFDVPM